VDVITGDWRSEANMAVMSASQQTPREVVYVAVLLEALAPAIPDIAKYGIRLV
jgi:hypothetical protein